VQLLFIHRYTYLICAFSSTSLSPRLPIPPSNKTFHRPIEPSPNLSSPRLASIDNGCCASKFDCHRRQQRLEQMNSEAYRQQRGHGLLAWSFDGTVQPQ
jgi:hypothetical protein